MNTFLGILPANTICFLLEGISASVQAIFNDFAGFLALFGITAPSIGGFFGFFLTCGSNVFTN